MTIELEVRAGETAVAAPIESAEGAAIVARQLIDAGATMVTVRERPAETAAGVVTPSDTKGAQPVVTPSDYTMQFVSKDEPPLLAPGSAMEQAFQVVGTWAEHADGDPDFVQAGDMGADLLSALTVADRWVDTNIFGTSTGQTVLSALPYGDIIQDSHDIRYQAVHGEETARTQQRAAAARAEREAAERAARERVQREQTAGEERTRLTRETNQLIRQAQAVTRAARRGEEPAIQRIVRVKERAAAGDPEARRLWKIYTSVADDDQQRIEAQL